MSDTVDQVMTNVTDADPDDIVVDDVSTAGEYSEYSEDLGDSNSDSDHVPVVEAPVVEAPVVEAPVVEAPVVEAPVVEAPVVEAPVVEAPVTGQEIAKNVHDILSSGVMSDHNELEEKVKALEENLTVMCEKFEMLCSDIRDTRQYKRGGSRYKFLSADFNTTGI
jgi:hypothetical protein